jgi:DNA invertase Pin-like site-specific DNA recombinase
MGYVVDYARVSTGDQDVVGQTMRLERAGAIRGFTDVKSGKSMDRPGSSSSSLTPAKGDGPLGLD